MATYEAPSHANITVGTSEVEVKAGSAHCDVMVQELSTDGLYVGAITGVEGASPSSGLGGILVRQYETFSVRLLPGQSIFLLGAAASQSVRVFVTEASQ